MTLINPSDQTITQYNVQTGGATNTLNNVAPSVTSGVPLISQGNAAQPIFGTVTVAGGGTGDTSFTTFAPICGGTTSTGALQQATTNFATAGFVLTSNGNAALPSWEPSSLASFSVKNRVFTTSQTYTPTSGMVYCLIQSMGAGGAGGGAAATSGVQNSVGQGGGAGEYAYAVFSAAAIGVSKVVTIGAGGVGVSAGTGGNGGTTSVGTLISCGGGLGGVVVTATGNLLIVADSLILGGTGGSTAGQNGDDFRVRGNNPFSSIMAPSLDSTGISGKGADSQLGAGGASRSPSTGGAHQSLAGNNASGYGAGGGGAVAQSSASAQAGGNGSSGVVIITEFIA